MIRRATFAACVLGLCLLLMPLATTDANPGNCCTVSVYTWSNEFENTTKENAQASPPGDSDNRGSNGSASAAFTPTMSLKGWVKASVSKYEAHNSDSTNERRARVQARAAVGLKVDNVCQGWYYRWNAEGNFLGKCAADSVAASWLGFVAGEAYAAGSAAQEFTEDLVDEESVNVASAVNSGPSVTLGVGATGPNGGITWGDGPVTAPQSGRRLSLSFGANPLAGGPGPITQVSWRGWIDMRAYAHSIWQHSATQPPSGTSGQVKAEAHGGAMARATVSQTISCRGGTSRVPSETWTVGWHPEKPPSLRRTAITPSGSNPDPVTTPPVTPLTTPPPASPSGGYPNSGADTSLDPADRVPGFWRSGGDEPITHPAAGS